MAEMSRRLIPPVLPLPKDLKLEAVDLETALSHVPANALIVVESEPLFLGFSGILQDLKRTILNRNLGHVYFGKIEDRWVFLLYTPSKSFDLSKCVEILKPNAVIVLGFCTSLKRTVRVKDFIVAEDLVLPQNLGSGKPSEYQCSEFLRQIFTSGKFGWQFGENHEVHVGSVMLGSSPTGGKLASRAADSGKISRMEEAVKASGPIIATCRSTLANQELLQTLQSRQERQSCDWIVVTAVTNSTSFHRFRTTREIHEQYLASVMASFVHRVLQEDQVFRILEENSSSRASSPTSLLSLPRHLPHQESRQCHKVLASTYDVNALKLEDTGCTRSVIDQTNWYWQKAREAVLQGNLQNPVLKNKRGRWNVKRASKTPVENTQEGEKGSEELFACDVSRANDSQPFSTKQILRGGDVKEHNLANQPVPPLPLQPQVSTVASCFTSVMQTLLPPVGSTVIARGARIEIIDVHASRNAVNFATGLPFPGPYLPALPPINGAKRPSAK